MNVRIDDEDAAKVEELRRRGVEFSSLVRNAIRNAYDENVSKRMLEDIDRIMADIYARHPDPPGSRPRSFSIHKHKQMRGAVVARLRRKRPT